MSVKVNYLQFSHMVWVWFGYRTWLTLVPFSSVSETLGVGLTFILSHVFGGIGSSVWPLRAKVLLL